MRTFLLPLAIGAFFASNACSSSSTDPAPTSDAASDTATTPDVGKDTSKPPTDTTVDETPALDGDGVDTYKPPTDKCAGKSCPGAYQACCPSTGSCYDNRCLSCCY